MGGTELNFEVQSQSVGYHNIVTNFSYDIRESLYCDNCNNCESCFGSVGLKNKKYCIFNKQYSKEEYEKLVSKIIEKLIEEKFWGEFFPMELSPFGYNETFANHYWEKTKEEVIEFGAKWQDNDFGLKFDGEFYSPEDDVTEYAKSEEKRKALLSGILKCEATGKPYKILPFELAFYIKNNIPVPRKSSEARMKEKHDLINIAKFYERECMCEGKCETHEGKCGKMFMTSFAPDRPEKVYCENCYEKAVQ